MLFNSRGFCILLLFLTCYFQASPSVLAFSNSPTIEDGEEGNQTAQSFKKVDQLMAEFDRLFTKASKEQRNANKDRIIQLGEKMLQEATKANYRKAEIIAYGKLSEMYKYFKVPNLYLKYNLKYKQNKRELEQIQKKELDEIKRQQTLKEVEIKKLEQDKDLNKELIELKKAELEATKSALNKTIYRIEQKDMLIEQKDGELEENQLQIKMAQDSIVEQNRINQTLAYEKKILEDEKRIIELKEKAAKSRNWMFVLIGAIAIIVALFLTILLFSMRRSQQQLRLKNKQIEEEKKRSDDLLLNILPAETAEELKLNGFAKAQSFDNVTVFFSDFKDFTLLSQKLTPSELVEEIDVCFKAFDKIIERYNIEKIKTVGDAYICVGGLDHSKEHDPRDVIDAALEIREFVNQRIEKLKKENKIFFEVRIGIHTGPVVAGIVGFKKFAYDIWGDTVNSAARMEQNSEPGKINVSAATFEMVKEDYSFTYRGKIEVKNRGELEMYFVHERIS